MTTRRMPSAYPVGELGSTSGSACVNVVAVNASIEFKFVHALPARMPSPSNSERTNVAGRSNQQSWRGGEAAENAETEGRIRANLSLWWCGPSSDHHSGDREEPIFFILTTHSGKRSEVD